MEYLLIYLLQLFDRIDALNFALWVTLVIVFSIYAVAFLFYLSDRDYFHNIKQSLKVGRKILVRFFIVALITMCIPTKQTLLLLSGTYLGKKAVKQVVTDEKIKKIDTIINLELDKKIKELKGAN